MFPNRMKGLSSEELSLDSVQILGRLCFALLEGRRGSKGRLRDMGRPRENDDCEEYESAKSRYMIRSG